MVVDELIVVLGLDTRKLNEDQRNALEAFRRTQEEAQNFGNNVERSANKMSGALSTVQKGILGIVAGLAGGGAIAFVERIVQMDAATGRLARTIGTSVPNLSTWQYMLKQVGGTAEEANSALGGLQDQINNFRAGNGMFDNQTAFLLSKIGGLKGRNSDQVLRDLGGYFRGEIGAGRMTTDMAASQLRWLPGMNQGTINTLLGDFDAIEKAATKSAVASEKSAAAAEKAQSRQASLEQGLERGGLSVIDALGTKAGEDSFSNWLGTKLGFGSVGAGDGFFGGLKKQLFGGGGGSRGDRNNNPGNIKAGKFASDHGATGNDGGFAVFPSYAAGAAAQEALVHGSGYQGLTLDQFAARYAEGNPAWRNTVGGALGIGPNDIVNNQDPRLIAAIRRAEGTGARGAAATRAGGGNSSTSHSEVHIGELNVNAPKATDADGVADGMHAALARRWGVTNAANSSLW